MDSRKPSITREGFCWQSRYSRASAKRLDQAAANGCFWHLYSSQVCPIWLSVSRANIQALTCPFETEWVSTLYIKSAPGQERPPHWVLYSIDAIILRIYSQLIVGYDNR